MTDLGAAMARGRGRSRDALQDRGLSRSRRLVLGAAPLTALLLAWHVTSTNGLLNATVFPAPYGLAAETVDLLLSGELWEHTVVSMGRIIAGLLLSISIALPLGFLLGGLFKTFGTAVNPLVQLFSQANPFTLWPLFILLLGLGEGSKVAMVMWVAIWPILFGTVAGTRNVDPLLVKMARSLGLNKPQLFTKIMIPAAAPLIFANLRFAALLSFFVLVGAEMLGSHSGLGYLIFTSCPFHTVPPDLEKMWVGIAMVALLGFLTDNLILQLEKRLSGWKEEAIIR